MCKVYSKKYFLMSIYVWEPRIISTSDMQWPAPDGFHVPLSSEWQSLCGILTSTFWLANNATTIGTYLKMPMAGSRSYSTTRVGNAGTWGYYWSSTPYNTQDSYYFDFSSSDIKLQLYSSRGNGYSVRCFKNIPVIPTSSWTTLHQGSWSAWVFYNATAWLISVSWDWNTWVTIADKNLWATTVFNQWDTVNDDNSWYFYQWGNNYGFPHSWSLESASYRQVDASNYWPWNYYESSTWITTKPRDTSNNNNLWWWVTQWTSTTTSGIKNLYIWANEVKEVYVWDTKVRPLIKEMYVCFLLVWGWGAGWYWCSSSSGWWRPWGWGWAWWVVQCCNQCISSWTYCINIWDWWKGCNDYCNWWDTTWFWITAYWWWGWWMNNKVWGNWWSWWWAWFCWVYGCSCSWQWHNWWTYLWTWCLAWAWGWWWYCWVWWNAYGTWKYDKRWNEYRHWWDWWQWVDIVIWNWAMTFSWAGWWWGWTHYYNYEWVNSCSWCHWSWWRWWHGQNEWWEGWIQWVAYIWYPQWWVEATWWTKTCCCWYVIHEFTESWEFSF